MNQDQILVLHKHNFSTPLLGSIARTVSAMLQWSLLYGLRVFLLAWRTAAAESRGRRRQLAVIVVQRLHFPWLTDWGNEAVFAADWVFHCRFLPIARLLFREWFCVVQVEEWRRSRRQKQLPSQCLPGCD